MNQLFKKYRSRMVRAAILKASGIGLIAGLAVNITLAFLSWMMEFYAGFWLAIGLGVAVGVTTALLLYFLKFRPSEKDIARKVDSLGLEERLITMMELENDDSYIAKRQREDAKEQVGKVAPKHLKIALSVAMIATLCVCGAVGIGMTTVSGLAVNNVIASGLDLIDPDRDEPNYYSVSYLAGEGGTIYGETEQTIAEGANTAAVTAVANDGFMFICWSDGATDPGRAENGVKGEVTLTAIFQPAPEDVTVELPEDMPTDFPGYGTGEEGNGPEGEDGDGPMDLEGGENLGGGEGEGEGAGGRYEENNQIVNGDTYYRDQFDSYYDNAMGDITSGDRNEEDSEMGEGYFNGLN